MHQYSNTADGLSLEALILSCSETVRAIAWRFARGSSRIDVDEFYAIGMLAVCEAAARAAAVAVDHPVAYLCRTAKNAMIDEWWRLHERSTVSLDAPLSDDSTLCLADLLASPDGVLVAPSKGVEALYDALRQLTAKQRAVLLRKYGFSGYGAHSEQETAHSLGCSPSTVKMAAYAGRRNLARDAGLCEALGLEVQ